MAGVQVERGDGGGVIFGLRAGAQHARVEPRVGRQRLGVTEGEVEPARVLARAQELLVRGVEPAPDLSHQRPAVATIPALLRGAPPVVSVPALPRGAPPVVVAASRRADPPSLVVVLVARAGRLVVGADRGDASLEVTAAQRGVERVDDGGGRPHVLRREAREVSQRRRDARAAPASRAPAPRASAPTVLRRGLRRRPDVGVVLHPGPARIRDRPDDDVARPRRAAVRPVGAPRIAAPPRPGRDRDRPRPS